MDGKVLRSLVPRSAHAPWEPPHDRDPLSILEAVFDSLLPDLRALRAQRMLASPFTYYRGSPAVMAADLAHTPTSGITTQICGDAHVGNFGGFATPERRLVFDVNDFDETARGPWEWDVKRLAASLALAAHDGGLRQRDGEDAVRLATRTYRTRMQEYAHMPAMEVWYASIDIEGAVRTALDKRTGRRWQQDAREAQARTALAVLPSLCEPTPDGLRFVDAPPLLQRIPEFAEFAEDALRAYVSTLRHDARMLLARFKLVDVARKVVGVGSVGTWCALALFVDEHGHPLLLQLKEARESVVERYAGPSPFDDHAERIVAGQRVMQAASDALLGWCAVQGRSVYVRQFRDMKTAPNPVRLAADELADYAAHCGWALARAHARTGDPLPISSYLGRKSAFDDAIVAFANAYAEQTIQDHAAFVKAAPMLARAGNADALAGKGGA